MGRADSGFKIEDSRWEEAYDTRLNLKHVRGYGPLRTLFLIRGDQGGICFCADATGLTAQRKSPQPHSGAFLADAQKRGVKSSYTGTVVRK